LHKPTVTPFSKFTRRNYLFMQPSSRLMLIPLGVLGSWKSGQICLLRFSARKARQWERLQLQGFVIRRFIGVN